MVGGNAALLLEDYTGSFESMIRDIDTATDYVHVEFYILVLDPTTAPFMDALGRAVERGVAVRVLSDHLAGLLDSNREGTRERLRELGAEWHAMLPLRPWRGSGSARTCATTARSSSSTGAWPTPGRRTSSTRYYNKRNIKRGRPGTS